MHQPKPQDRDTIRTIGEFNVDQKLSIQLTGTVHRGVCPFTPQLSLVVTNWSVRDGMLSWRWYTAAAGGIRTCDLAVTSPALYHTTTSALVIIRFIWTVSFATCERSGRGHKETNCLYMTCSVYWSYSGRVVWKLNSTRRLRQRNLLQRVDSGRNLERNRLRKLN